MTVDQNWGHALTETADHLRGIVASVAASYFKNSHVPTQEIPGVISQIAAGLSLIGAAPSVPLPDDQDPVKPTAAQIRKSITAEAIISFEDGKQYKTLKRHLTLRGLSPSAYRTKWGLPPDYPMTAPGYSARRSELAKTLGLGRLGGKAPKAKS